MDSSSAGSRKITTFKKLPTTAPMTKAENNYDGQEHNNSFFLVNVVKN